MRAGRMSMNRFVEIPATAPAKIFGRYPREGRGDFLKRGTFSL